MLFRSAIVPLATEPHTTTRTVNVRYKGVQIQNLTIERQGVVDYLKKMTADKIEVALVHALEVGIVEIESRRAQFQRRTVHKA